MLTKTEFWDGLKPVFTNACRLKVLCRSVSLANRRFNCAYVRKLVFTPALLRLRQSLLRHAGGDRVMAQVLAVVPQSGLDAVLVAVEVLLEGATPNGGISVEHVRNVLARLSSPPMPQQAETSLQLSEVPLANTARYDGLRSGVEVSYD